MNKIIGQIIKERVEASKINVVEFAKLIGVERTNVYNIYKRDSIDTALLKKIGQVLKYDFFQDLLEPETIKQIVLKERIGNVVYVPINLTEEEIEKVKLKDKVIENL
ncbi:MAG: helix-turn-helix domain-containing protein [Paludibacteraceae bacterium]|nr:helix-turn-helix domain-containing protein [Paludibacteraceae bacterium]